MSAAASALASLPRSLAARVRPALRLSPRMRGRLIVAAALLALLGLLYFAWFRNSSLVAVERVTVTGLTAENAPRIRAAIADAARDMTTLNVDEAELEHAVADFPVVYELQVSTNFPHDLRVEVVERPPVAVLVAPDGKRVPVAADGTVLQGVSASSELPPVELGASIPRYRVGDPEAMRAVSVIAAAPDALAAQIEEVGEESGKGIVAKLEAGPDVLLGDASALQAKWAAAARVLADPAAAGATYVDVRLPDRPVAGGLPPEETVSPEDPATPALPAEPALPEAVVPTVPEPPVTTPPTETPAPTG